MPDSVRDAHGSLPLHGLLCAPQSILSPPLMPT
ncbi:hypothetical protein TSMEX_009478 [Taenia solium]|eukprot:TsM_000302600 transcript=TsM_000302600 gene=TsM_000302600